MKKTIPFVSIALLSISLHGSSKGTHIKYPNPRTKGGAYDIHPSYKPIGEVENFLKKAESFDTTHIFNRFKQEIADKFGITDENTAIKLKNEALRFLVMCATHPDKDIEMYSEEIDEFWHTFMLFSHDYFDFCSKLGVPYIHHSPNINEEDSTPHSSFKDFAELYQQTFNETLPAVWNYHNNKAPCGSACRATRCSVRCKSGGCGRCRNRCKNKSIN